MSQFSSPFPTSHDTVRTFTLRSPGSVDSPTGQVNGVKLSASYSTEPVPSRDDAATAPGVFKELSRSTSPSGQRNALDMLAEYSVNLDKFPGGRFGVGEQDGDTHPESEELKEEDTVSEIAGPEDFTMNIEKYLLGNNATQEKDLRNDQKTEQQLKKPLPREFQPSVIQVPDVGEYSEFGPPVDMSTPSHLLLRKKNGNGREETHLESIQESPAGSPDRAMTPSPPKQQKHIAEDDTYIVVLRQIEYLQEELRNKDEQILANRRRVLEAASALEQIKHLKAELQRKTTLLTELNARRGEDVLLREQVQLLQRQNDEKDRLLQQSGESQSKMDVLQQQVNYLKAELNRQDGLVPTDGENSKMISSLRQQLKASQEQLKKRDDALEESMTKLREVTASGELQLRRKDTEIENLKAEIDDQNLEMDRMEDNLTESNHQYNILEERIASLESRNQPLEEMNIELETKITRVRSQVQAQQNALHNVVRDFAIDVDGKTYDEILDLLNKLCQSKASTSPTQQQNELNELQTELSKLRRESTEIASAKESINVELQRSKEQLSECRALVTTIEGENSQLSSKLEKLNSSSAKIHEELERMKQDHGNALQTIEYLRQENKTQRAIAPLTSHGPDSPDYCTIQIVHQAELKSLQDGHVAAISAIRDSHNESTNALRSLLAVSERRESELRSQLDTLRETQSSNESQLETLSAEMSRLQTIIAIKEEATIDVDQWISRSVEKREKEWERRVNLLLKERDKMGKALMWSWGEKEVGHLKEKGDETAKGPRHTYQYKYVTRNGNREKV